MKVSDIPRATWRRFTAVAALVVGLTLAWWQGPEPAAEVQVALLLTRAVVDTEGTHLDRSYLRDVHLKIPASAGSNVFSSIHTLHYDHGKAPPVSTPIGLSLPGGVTQVEVSCSFAMGRTGPRIASRGLVAVDRSRSDLQVIDVGQCGLFAQRP